MADLSALDDFFGRCYKLFLVANHVGGKLEREIAQNGELIKRRDFERVRHFFEPLQLNLQLLNRAAASLVSSPEMDALCSAVQRLEKSLIPYLQPSPANRALAALPSLSSQLVASLRNLGIVQAARDRHPVPSFYWPSSDPSEDDPNLKLLLRPLGGAKLADALGVHPTRRGAFFRQLTRQRLSLGEDSWHEECNRRPNSPQFVYFIDSPKLRALAAEYKNPKKA